MFLTAVGAFLVGFGSSYGFFNPWAFVLVLSGAFFGGLDGRHTDGCI